MSKSKAYVVGVGMTPFTRPGSTGKDYPELVKDAVTEALNDCGLKYTDVEQAAVGYLYGGSCCAQRALYEVGMTGIPIYNVNNACASGSSAIFLGKQMIEGGNVDVFLAAGFEKMKSGSLDGMNAKIDDRAVPADKHIKVVAEEFGWSKAPAMCQFFGNAGVEHMKKYGTKREHFAKIGYKNHLHSVNNPKSQFRDKYTLDQVLNARKVFGPLGLLECSPTSDGSAAVVIVSERWLQKHPKLREQAVEIVGQELTTDLPSAYHEHSAIKATGFDMAQKGARALFSKAGLTPNDVQVIELHDCFATNELITYEALGLCPVGKAGELIDRGDNTYGGRWVINPSGGLISKGHPIGATGVAQCVELCNQLRGRCGKRQVPNVRVALQHNLGIGGACVVSLYRRADGGASPGGGVQHFTKPGSTGKDYPDMIKEAVNEALDDCRLKYADVQQATVGYLYGGTCCGQRALYEIGFTGIPIFNVNNACASGSSGVFLCKQILESGNADVVMAVGFEKMAPGSLEKLQPTMDDRALPVDRHINVMSETFGLTPSPITCQMFGHAGQEHMEKYGTKREHFAKIGYKNHLHSVHNPKSQFQKKYSLDDVLKARKIHEVLGLLEASPTSDGAAAIVIVSERWLQKHPQLRPQAVEIAGMELGTDEPSVFAENSNIKMIGFDMVQRLANRLYKNTGMSPKDIQVIELHDCFAANELITYEAIGLCPVGKGAEIVDRNDNTYGGKWVVNPSGGLISKGHPIGATGVAQVVELSNQLRGRCGKRQVPNARVGMQHNIGIGGACVVALYRLADGGGANTTVANTHEVMDGEFRADAVFHEIKARIQDEKELAKKAQGSYRFTLTSSKGNRKSWTVDLKKSPPYVGTESTEKVDVELILSDDVFVAISTGKLKPDQAFMQGKMKIKGNIMKAMKLKDILNPTQTDSMGNEAEFKSDVEKDAKKADGSFRFTLTSEKGNKKSWTVDMNKSPPYVGIDSTDKVDVELVLKEADFIAISAGKLKPDQAFMQGKMKIKGNIMKAMKLKTILDPSQLKAKL
ncbi:Sterol carrier protein 2 [Aphelenchoides fujianensis]|nr:Sterol carrier protein 2 [Aphelenchoides fujianensis]